MILFKKAMQEFLKKEDDLLEKAILIASLYHFGQKDKASEAYIQHPLAVMNRLKTKDEKIVGVLHDIIEDTEITEEDLRELGFQEIHILGIRSVTKRKGETYDEAIYRASQNPIGKNVKKADLSENMNIDRIPKHLQTQEDIDRVEKYKRAYEILENVGITWFWVERSGKYEWMKKSS